MITKIILIIICLGIYYIGKTNGYKDGFIDGRLEEKFKRWEK